MKWLLYFLQPRAAESVAPARPAGLCGYVILGSKRRLVDYLFIHGFALHLPGRSIAVRFWFSELDV